jgi:hypothetical protein
MSSPFAGMTRIRFEGFGGLEILANVQVVRLSRLRDTPRTVAM